VKPQRQLSKDDVLRLAERPGGFMVHIYKWADATRRKQLNRYKREGLVTREVWGDYFVFRRANELRRNG
jgi:hypothetical protein